MSASSELTHLFRALKAPAAARALPKLADRAREEEWSYERFAQALLSTEHASREAHGGEGRIKAARFPARKTLEEFDFTFQRSVKRTLIQHLGQLDFLHGKENVVLLGPPGTGKTHLSIALGIRACLAAGRLRRPGIPHKIKNKGVHFQPARRGAFSTGLDNREELRPPSRHGEHSKAVTLPVREQVAAKRTLAG